MTRKRSSVGRFLLFISALRISFAYHVDAFSLLTSISGVRTCRNMYHSAASAIRSTKTGARATCSAKSKSQLQMVFDVPDLEVEQSKMSTQVLIDKILDECLRYSARRPIMRQFDPASKSIWRQWRGTVVSETWKSAARHALWAVCVYLVFQRYPKCTEFFTGFHRIWGEVLLAVTTFTLTFFVNEAYSCWRNCLDICFNLQGRMNDLGAWQSFVLFYFATLVPFLALGLRSIYLIMGPPSFLYLCFELLSQRWLWQDVQRGWNLQIRPIRRQRPSSLQRRARYS